MLTRTRTQRRIVGVLGATALALGGLGVDAAAADPALGAVTVAPATVVSGTSADLTFSYTAPGSAVRGLVAIRVPAGWSAPQAGDPAGRGYVAVAPGTCSRASLVSIAAEPSGATRVTTSMRCPAGASYSVGYAAAVVPTPLGPTRFTAALKLSDSGTFRPLTPVPAVTVVAPSWTPTGNLVPDVYPVQDAIRLLDGRVMANSNFTNIYDPDSGTWDQVAGPRSVSAGYTATLLADGRVLAVGGGGGPAAELFDPRTLKWSPTGSPAEGRIYHTATLLRNGQVLVASGLGTDRIPRPRLRSAEVYDPTSGTWSPAGAWLGGGRHFAAATLLASGDVLIIGGSYYASAVLYHPQDRTWSYTGSMAHVRQGHTATRLLDGRVLVTGGTGDPESKTTSELYDPVSGSWSSAGSLTYRWNGHAATLRLDGTVLLTGGADAHTELYEPVTARWTEAAPMSQPRPMAPAVLLRDGQILVAGGSALSSEPLTSELFG